LPPPPDAPPTYQVSPREAFIYIRDNDPGAPQVRLDIISPTNGEHLALGPVVELSAIATYDFGEVEFVDFYSDEAWIGWSVVFQGERPPINGLPSVHAIRWTNPPVGLAFSLRALKFHSASGPHRLHSKLWGRKIALR